MSNSTPLVLFDIDGTLMRGAGQHHKNALIEGIRRVTGVSTHLDGVATSGMLDRDLIVSMLRTRGHSQRAIRTALSEIMAECQSAYVEGCLIDLEPFLCLGVKEFITQLKARSAVLGLVTGNLTQIGWRKMELAGIRDYFSVGAFAEDGRTRAQLARVAVRRARRLGLIQANARVSLIGDHGNDVRAAKINGFQSIAVATGLSSPEELQQCGPDILVRNLGELDIETVLYPIARARSLTRMRKIALLAFALMALAGSSCLADTTEAVGEIATHYHRVDVPAETTLTFNLDQPWFCVHTKRIHLGDINPAAIC